jgi:ornithine lipid ester-linked acyl 2-hydroxylase
VTIESAQAGALWQDAGAVGEAAARAMLPELAMLSGTRLAGASKQFRRPSGIGKPLRALLDRFVARHSLIATDPVLDVRDFAWTEALRANWQAIRDEAAAASLPCGRGHMERTRCPVTTRLVAAIPGLDSAGFAVLPAGTHLPPGRGLTKGLVTCHLALAVPRDGDVRMRVEDRVLRWAEGETLVFDDSFDHEAWNDAAGPRLVLRIQFRRPVRQPARWLVDRLLAWRRAAAD